MTSPSPARPQSDSFEGLFPAVIQHSVTGDVLMLGYMNQEALSLTRESGQVHFWSRSRARLWRKGETSGNVLWTEDVRFDCDGDALVVTARPEGPVCHTGAAACFSGHLGAGFKYLDVLWATILDRLDSDPDESYTARLASAGPDQCGRKVLEEATEVLLALKDHANGAADDRRLAEEAADLIYHLLVAIAERGVAAELVTEVLRQRATE